MCAASFGSAEHVRRRPCRRGNAAGSGAPCVKTALRRLHAAPRSVTSATERQRGTRSKIADRSSRSIAATAPVPCDAGVSGDGGVQGNLARSRLRSEFYRHTPRIDDAKCPGSPQSCPFGGSGGHQGSRSCWSKRHALAMRGSSSPRPLEAPPVPGAMRAPCAPCGSAMRRNWPSDASGSPFCMRRDDLQRPASTSICSFRSARTGEVLTVICSNQRTAAPPSLSVISSTLRLWRIPFRRSASCPKRLPRVPLLARRPSKRCRSPRS